MIKPWLIIHRPRSKKKKRKRNKKLRQRAFFTHKSIKPKNEDGG
jgi:hypothetical protein